MHLLGVGWFPATEWSVALERWPKLADELPAAHDAYRAAVEARMRAMQPRTSGSRLALVALRVEELEAFAAERGLDAGSAEARGAAAADGARQGWAVLWPPGRNDPCWCGSGEKYKRCCAPLARQGAGGAPGLTPANPPSG
jgi:uncharacterized protein YecA (UPF0149 family)